MATLIRGQFMPSRIAFLLGVMVFVLAAVLLMVTSTQQDYLFSRYFFILLFVNAIGVVLLLFAFVLNAVRVLAQLRRKEAGARLTVRLIVLFSLITVIPTVLVFIFSMQFLAKGIDSWFDERIERALTDAGSLGQISIEAIAEESFTRLEGLQRQFARAISEIDLIRSVNRWRIDGEYDEISVYNLAGQIVAFSRADFESFPSSLPRTMSSSARQSDIEIADDGSWQLRQIFRLAPDNVQMPATILAIKRLPSRQSSLASSVDSALSQYGQLKYLRGRLKQNYGLILSLVVGTVLLMTLWISVFLAKMTVHPIRELLAATQAVAEGDYAVQLSDNNPNNEFGALISSFNVMTKRVQMAQADARQYAQSAENQRLYLATVLEHLRTGVMGFNDEGIVSVINPSGLNLLHLEEDDMLGRSVDEIEQRFPWLTPLFQPMGGGNSTMDADNLQIDIWSPHGKMVLRVSYSATNAAAPRAGVVVFDDLTTLLKAQRDAAWGEVARRLAHEIKNPLTPIQLSAERLRLKFSGQKDEVLQRTLDRSTSTIVNQVESLKTLVNEFSRYAQPVDVQLGTVDVVALAREVIDLYKPSVAPARLELLVDDGAVTILADTTRMRQVFTNLIVNASESQKDRMGLKIEVQIDQVRQNQQSMAKISIRDNGPGFAKDVLEHVFEPYASTKGRGSGLGLAIVKRIVDEHGGYIDAYNEHGAVVAIFLPLDSKVPSS